MTRTSTSRRLLSGLQKDVLSLYRTILREAVKKDRAQAQAQAHAQAASAATAAAAATTTTPISFSFSSLLSSSSATNQMTTTMTTTTTTTTAFARMEFRRQAQQVKRSDFKTIEYKIRKGQKQVKLLQMPGVVRFRSRSTTV